MTAGKAGGARPADGPRFFHGAVRAETVRLGHDAYRSEHLLLALLRDPVGPSARALRACRVDPDAVVRDAEARAPRGSASPSSGHLPFEPGMKSVMEAALEEAGGSRSERLGLEHLLLGLVRSEGLGGEVLRSCGATVEGLRAAVAAAAAADGP